MDERGVEGEGRSAIVIGCGLGDDAEALQQLGFQVTASDIAATAIDWCHQRFPNSNVNYRVADLFNLDPTWHAAFDTDLTINQPCAGGLGETHVPQWGFGANPQVRVFSNTCNFRLKSVPFVLTLND